MDRTSPSLGEACHAALVLVGAKATPIASGRRGALAWRRMAESQLAPLIASLSRSLSGVERGRADLEGLVSGALPDDARGLFTRAPRLVGKEPASFTDAERASVNWPLVLAADEVVRILVLARAGEKLGGPELAELVDAVYRHGEARERMAVLRALPFLRAPERFVALAGDACRTHVVPIFEAIACENPFPAQHFPPDAFRQMVLKAVFVEVPVRRIHGLDARLDAELARMARGYASERAAAGRVIPEDATWLGSQA
jgi:hypothetical protein